jgi:hypothetical protein
LENKILKGFGYSVSHSSFARLSVNKVSSIEWIDLQYSLAVIVLPCPFGMFAIPRSAEELGCAQREEC